MPCWNSSFYSKQNLSNFISSVFFGGNVHILDVSYTNICPDTIIMFVLLMEEMVAAVLPTIFFSIHKHHSA